MALLVLRETICLSVVQLLRENELRARVAWCLFQTGDDEAKQSLQFAYDKLKVITLIKVIK